MPKYIIKMYKTAVKDYKELERKGMKDKADAILSLLSEDPYKTPPKYEELSGQYRGTYSRRLNRQDRVVYEIRDTDDTDVKEVVVIRMGTHYKGIIPIAFF